LNSIEPRKFAICMEHGLTIESDFAGTKSVHSMFPPSGDCIMIRAIEVFSPHTCCPCVERYARKAALLATRESQSRRRAILAEDDHRMLVHKIIEGTAEEFVKKSLDKGIEP
jgi:hypothetical protein